MPKKYPPLTPSEVLDILKKLGFEFITQEGSHRHFGKKGWEGKVTVDMAEAEFGNFLIQSMIAQSGTTRDEFYGATKATAKKINMRFKKD